MQVGDTIAAIATPPGTGGVAIIRVSGPKVQALANDLLGQLPAARKAHYASFKEEDGVIIDQGIVLYFPAPHSFTGEHVLELHGHGGVVVMDLLLRRVFQLGARPARPGEFSERAFLNNKLDLTQAEAIADLIASETIQAARASQRSLQGEFSAQIHALVAELTQLRVFVEATLDFPEEELKPEVDYLAEGKVYTRILALQQKIKSLQATAKQGSLLREGMRVVIAGPPNAGKSTLMNALASRSCAIVSPYPGTTRDVLSEQINLEGMPLHIVDTAGLRENVAGIEQEGIKRAWQEIHQADRILLLMDVTTGFPADFSEQLENLPAETDITLLYNKMDIATASTATPDTKIPWLEQKIKEKIGISAKAGSGLATLRQHLKECMGFGASTEGLWIARRRHLEALQTAAAALLRCSQQMQVELLAEELRDAQQALGQITGAVSSDQLLGEIFSSFCIGK